MNMYQFILGIDLNFLYNFNNRFVLLNKDFQIVFLGYKLNSFSSSLTHPKMQLYTLRIPAILSIKNASYSRDFLGKFVTSDYASTLAVVLWETDDKSVLKKSC